MSLWSINDQASSQLMERFYFYLRSSNSIMDALQKAKLEMIGFKPFSHPFYWAAFVITGDAAKVIFPK
jgi:CHAT domain-containing protein